MLELKINKHLLEAGTDEAGRGCLAGPVTAAAVILPDNFTHPFLTDSKQLSEKKRNQLREIIEKEAISFNVTHIQIEKIDKINILNASILAMHEAISGLSHTPKFIAFTGNQFKPLKDILIDFFLKVNGNFFNIVEEFILAKTYRDKNMVNLDFKFPKNNWKKTKDIQQPNIEMRF